MCDRSALSWRRVFARCESRGAVCRSCQLHLMVLSVAAHLPHPTPSHAWYLLAARCAPPCARLVHCPHLLCWTMAWRVMFGLGQLQLTIILVCVPCINHNVPILHPAAICRLGAQQASQLVHHTNTSSVSRCALALHIPHLIHISLDCIYVFARAPQVWCLYDTHARLVCIVTLM